LHHQNETRCFEMFLANCVLKRYDALLPSLVVPCRQTLVFCTGQIYYELLGEREKLGVNNVALVRLEQIAPFPFDCVAENAKKYSNAEIVWAQQEPK
jgi:2-oxoglutarate dehydrogenase complex dehydrogenase (E1) component-like enzyme